MIREDVRSGLELFSAVEVDDPLTRRTQILSSRIL